MNGFVIAGVITIVFLGVVMAFLTNSIYGGSKADLSRAKIGEVYNFLYEQPHHGDSERYLAKVVDVWQLSDDSIRRLNSTSNYRAQDLKSGDFQRTHHLVTCAMPNGSVRNFYAERTKSCRRPLLGKMLFPRAVIA